MTPARGPRPPRFWEAVLRAVLGRRVADRSILGDLHEEFLDRASRHGVGRATRWYRREALAVSARRIWSGRGQPESIGATRDSTLRQGLAELMGAGRSLRRSPAFAAATVLTLALAIGAATAVFTVIDGVLLNPLPYEHQDRLAWIGSTAPGMDAPPEFGISEEFFVQYGNEAEGIEELGLFSGFGGTLTVDGEGAERLRMSEVTSTLFSTLGVEPVHGRLPTDEDYRTSEFGMALISEGLWTRRYGADPGILGQTIEVLERPFLVMGVMPGDFRFPEEETAAWIPFLFDPERARPLNFGWQMVARMRPGLEPQELHAQLVPLVERLPTLYPEVPTYAALLSDGQYRPVVKPLRDQLVGDLKAPLWILLGTTGLVLLVACANVANLFLVRGEARQGDMAVRAAMGASRGRLVGGHLAEALVLAALGGAAGAGLAWLGLPLLLRAGPEGVPGVDAIGLDPTVVVFVLGVSLAAALLFGIAPALRYSSYHLLEGLRSSVRSVAGRRRSLGRDALAVAQSGLALVLLVGSGLLVRSFLALRDVDPGFATEDVVSFQLALPESRYPGAVSKAEFHQSFLERLRGLGPVEAAGAIQELPLDEVSPSSYFAIADDPQPDEALLPLVTYSYVAQGYFETMRIPLLGGRAFVPADHGTELGNVIVSRAMAERHWPGENPIGKQLRMARDTTGWDTVVGVVGDVRAKGLRIPPDDMVYFPLVRRGLTEERGVDSPAYVVRGSNAATLLPMLRDEVASVDPTLPIYAVHTLEELLDASEARLTFTMIALGVSALMALLLGSIGLYGVLSYVVSRRTHEIGLRMALGAQRGQLRRMVVAQGLRLAGIGLGLGLMVALGLAQWLQSLLYGVDAFDPLTFAATSALLIGVAYLASYLPARRASSVDPMRAMRVE